MGPRLMSRGGMKTAIKILNTLRFNGAAADEPRRRIGCGGSTQLTKLQWGRG